jgi:hypothetical protein
MSRALFLVLAAGLACANAFARQPIRLLADPIEFDSNVTDTPPPTVDTTTTTLPTKAPPSTSTAAPTTTTPFVKPTTTEDPNICSGHGHCTCDYGYDGADCSHAVDFCAQPVRDMEQYTNFSQACAPHGHCQSDDGIGARCVCDEDWSGPFCKQHDDHVLVTTRCYLRAPLGSTPSGPSISVGCSDTKSGTRQICVPDNLNCWVDPDCPDPIGWCIPRESYHAIKKFMETMQTSCRGLSLVDMI